MPSPGFASPRILDRDLATIAGDHEAWRRLEDRLERFTAELEREAIDERDVAAATRTYVAKLGAAGLLRLVVPGEFGGEHERVSATAICLVRQWLARVSGALDTAFVMQGLGSFPLVLAGSPDLRRLILPKVARGELICAFALTEPEAGSDVSGMQKTVTQASTGHRSPRSLDIRPGLWRIWRPVWLLAGRSW
jgi:acyl-CoA dehydrogenase